MQDITINLFAVVLLLTINGFFVAAEFSLVKARGFRLESVAQGGSASARLTLHIQANLESYLAACQLGITMASLGLGWVGEPAVAALLEPLFLLMGVPETLLHSVAFLVGFLIFSSLHIVVGEQVPKTFAIRRAEPVAVWCAYPLHAAYLLVYPLNWLLNISSRSILSLFNVEEATHADVLSGEELKGLVQTSHEHGQIEHGKADMLHNLFEFDQYNVGRVMVPRSSLNVLDVSAAPENNLAVLRDSGHSRFPVIDTSSGEEVLGIVLAKDLYTAVLSGDSEPWRNLRAFCREPLMVPESQKVSSLFDSMRRNKAHMTLVIDEYGTLSGIVTLEDLLEEIVGEIRDETDVEGDEAIINEIDASTWHVDGLLSLTDIERGIGLSVPAELDANTLSGLFMERLSRMPETGDSIIENEFRLTVK
ncbi:MAG: HlyC/CorC family transporter, partial [Halobacteria archaeon]|nr:HlyC/CorC family transporter [Halobacteria archaeon]